MNLHLPSAGVNRYVSAVALTLACGLSQAAPYVWTDWTGADLTAGTAFSAQGTITTPTTTLQVTYANPLGVGFYQASGGTDYYTGGSGATSPYTSTAVDNRPTGSDIVALQFAGTQTLQFSVAIANPVFAFVSLNGNGYEFDQDFEILSLGGVDGNACGFWGCGGASKVVVNVGGATRYQLNSNNAGGTEPHGTLRFLGTFDTLTWRSTSNEFWNGFTVGVLGTAADVCQTNPTLPGCGGVVVNPPTQVPLPGTLPLIGVAFAALALARRRRPV